MYCEKDVRDSIESIYREREYCVPTQREIPSYMSLVNKKAFEYLSYEFRHQYRDDDLSYITFIYDVSVTDFKLDIEKRLIELKGCFNVKKTS